jgi:hypothetical protein
MGYFSDITSIRRAEMLDVPIDPTLPEAPVKVKRRPPASVTVASLFMMAGSALGLVLAAVLIGGLGPLLSGFRARAAELSLASADIDAVGSSIRRVFVCLAIFDAALAAGFLVAALGVRRGRGRARAATLVLIAGAFVGGIAMGSFTALGSSVDWAATASNSNEGLASAVSHAYSDALPVVLSGTTGGLTDLQCLGYIAVAVLLLVPASNDYFRRRPVALVVRLADKRY